MRAKEIAKDLEENGGKPATCTSCSEKDCSAAKRKRARVTAAGHSSDTRRLADRLDHAGGHPAALGPGTCRGRHCHERKNRKLRKTNMKIAISLASV